MRARRAALATSEPVVDDEVVDAGTRELARQMLGRTLAEVASLDTAETSSTTGSEVASAARRALIDGQKNDADHVFIGGTSEVAAAFDAVDSVRSVLRILEQQLVVVSLLSDVLDRGLSVAIGTETGMEPLADCSLVVAPYEVDGEPAGSIGVLGPTRMNYPQALAAVAVVSRRLGHRLSEG
jgi:heat-inducible transcriptional repressor